MFERGTSWLIRHVGGAKEDIIYISTPELGILRFAQDDLRPVGHKSIHGFLVQDIL